MKSIMAKAEEDESTDKRLEFHQNGIFQEKHAAIPAREDCPYTQCFCEENVWKLCDHVRAHAANKTEKCHAVFISNHIKAVPIWKQKSSKEPGKPVVWDYHVILIMESVNSSNLVYDLDSQLPFPTNFDVYVQESFGADFCLKTDFHRLFRVVPATQFLETFASDRSHMKKEDGSWQSPPPTYPPISTPVSTNNIGDFMSMDSAVGWGTVMDLQLLCNTYGSQDLFEQLPPLIK